MKKPMVVRRMFLLYFKGDRENKRLPVPAAICASYQEALDFYKNMGQDGGIKFEIVPVTMAIGVKIEPCVRVDTKNHIPLDLNKSAYPVRCDLCDSTVTYFCNAHSAIYCTDHIVSHGNVHGIPMR